MLFHIILYMLSYWYHILSLKYIFHCFFWVDFEIDFGLVYIRSDFSAKWHKTEVFSRKIVLASVRPSKDMLLSDNLYYFCMKTCVIHWSKNQSIKILEHFSTKLFAAKLREKTWKKHKSTEKKYSRFYKSTQTSKTAKR